VGNIHSDSFNISFPTQTIIFCPRCRVAELVKRIRLIALYAKRHFVWHSGVAGAAQPRNFCSLAQAAKFNLKKSIAFIFVWPFGLFALQIFFAQNNCSTASGKLRNTRGNFPTSLCRHSNDARREHFYL
jgi:hypothetical protein